MKLTIIGGGSVRSPLFAASAFRRAQRAGLEELCLMDIDAARLKIITGLCRQLGSIAGSPVRITHTTDPEEAFDGASYIVTTIRVGNEAGRVHDERIALNEGVLGQETTGPGGFAMAMRSIPAILEYAQLAEKLCPEAWIFNFTNPAGLVTQALHKCGFRRALGICDSANAAQHDTAAWLNVSANTLRTEVFGLNHLSWTKRIWYKDRDLLPALLTDPLYCASSSIKIFDPELLQMFGLHLNEYLYYYYYPDQALAEIKQGKETRGEEVYRLNQQLFELLSRIDIKRSPQEALAAYFSYEKRRSITYMQFANPNGPSPQEADQMKFDIDLLSPEGGEGYAGVSLDLITAIARGETYFTALNVPNAGAIPGIEAQDVVEISCKLENGQLIPLPIDEIPQPVSGLLYQMKTYENLAVDAILSRSINKGILALMSHPFVLSYPKAKRLLGDYLKVHASYTGEWS
jgi:6-phospho-beta-glucosidase